MALITNVLKRKGSINYYVRITVPKQLQATIGRKEIWKSLDTPDSKLAKRLAHPIIMDWDRKFETLLARKKLDEYELQHAIWERFTALMEADNAKRLALPSADDMKAVWKALVEEFGEEDITAWRIAEDIEATHETDKVFREQRLATLRAEIGKGETKSVADILRQVTTDRKLQLAPRSSDERKLAQALQRAEIEALTMALERDRGNFGSTPSDPIVRPPNLTAPLMAAPGETIMELFEKFAFENPKNVTAATINQSRSVVDLFSQFVGRHFPTTKISKLEVRKWKTALQSYPVKATETKAFRGMDFKQTIEANKKIGKPSIAAKTLNRYLAALGTYCHWLVAHGYLEDNPTSGMSVYVDKSAEQVKPYHLTQLQNIFGSPLFTGCQGDGKEHKPGNVLIRDHRFWLPLISLFSGARMGEICQLLTDDVQQLHGTWVFNINKDGDPAKHLKTKSSQRVLPIHSHLIKLGFLNYHQRMKAQQERWLFPEIKLDSRDQRAGRFSDFYGAYVRRLGVKVDKTVNFHSFRHGFADALRLAGHLDQEFAFLLGHTQNNVTGRYGSLTEGNLTLRARLIESVQYENLVLSNLQTN